MGAGRIMIWTVPKSWAGETCVILAGGPSLEGWDLSSIREPKHQPFEYDRPRIITVNDSWRLAPWADVCFFQDTVWWHISVISNRRSEDGKCDFADMRRRGFWVQGAKDANMRDHAQIHTLTTREGNCIGLEENPSALAHGCNSGYAAINLAYHFGVKRIILLGYDMRVSGHRTNWHAEPRQTASAYAETIRHSMLPYFAMPVTDSSGKVIRPSLVDALREKGVEVINSTPGSALKCWPYVPFPEVLNDERGKVVAPTQR